MKRILQTFVLIITAVQLMTAGGIVNNSNQSAKWVRTMVRDASIDVDAVFYNPAGLTRLEDGFYIQVNSQTISQNRHITSDLSYLNNKEFEGETFVPVLPTGYVAWKKGNLALSAGFTVIGGGGGAEFAGGLPSFEAQFAELVPSLSPLGPVGEAAGVDLNVSGFDSDIHFEGTSAYFGFQAGASYAVNEMISVALGGRYVSAKNTYKGTVKNITVTTANGAMPAVDFINNLALPTVNGTANNLTAITQIPGSLQPIIDLGQGGATLDQLVLGQIMSQEQADAINAAMVAIGQDPTGASVNFIAGAITQATPTLNGQIAQLNDNATALAANAARLGDGEVDVVQKGIGFTPIIGVDLSFAEDKIGLALRYEHLTKMEVTNETEIDDLGLYPDGETIPAEIPANFSIGLRYNPDAKWRGQVGVHYYLDNGAKYGRTDDSGNFVTNGEEAVFNGETTTLMESNSWEAAIGLEYDVTEKIAVSGGFLYAKTNPNAVYQTDISNTQQTSTIGLGVGLDLTSMLSLDLGFSYTIYDTFDKEVTYYSGKPYQSVANESYTKDAFLIGVGLTAKL